jgi:hypothetical protein
VWRPPPFTGNGLLKATGSATPLVEALSAGASRDEGLSANARSVEGAGITGVLR